ncbi:hypothetical protein GCM10011365_25560 [Marinicella pacifica]|uniref:Uncharacterized protein n=1 Tax=Marinicella pacifica TaxID=1171543 RepID=A0A917CZX5_9GAMM|nr:hypothetical protein [Marinicella pacifica]GGG03286.1 hypothetical protein GCM10011365_25560 [Marinicella pacifica]
MNFEFFFGWYFSQFNKDNISVSKQILKKLLNQTTLESHERIKLEYKLSRRRVSNIILEYINSGRAMQTDELDRALAKGGDAHSIYTRLKDKPYIYASELEYYLRRTKNVKYICMRIREGCQHASMMQESLLEVFCGVNNTKPIYCSKPDSYNLFQMLTSGKSVGYRDEFIGILKSANKDLYHLYCFVYMRGGDKYCPRLKDPMFELNRNQSYALLRITHFDIKEKYHDNLAFKMVSSNVDKKITSWLLSNKDLLNPEEVRIIQEKLLK